MTAPKRGSDKINTGKGKIHEPFDDGVARVHTDILDGVQQWSKMFDYERNIDLSKWQWSICREFFWLSHPLDKMWVQIFESYCESI